MFFLNFFVSFTSQFIFDFKNTNYFSFAAFCGFTDNVGNPVPIGMFWFIITFSTTESRLSTSPTRAAFMMFFIGVSKDALASTLDFSLTPPYLVMPLRLPVKNQACLQGHPLR